MSLDPITGSDPVTAYRDRINSLIGMTGGRSYVAAEQTTSSESFAALSTPDLVEDVVVAAGDLLYVWFRAMYKANVDHSEFQITLNGTPIKAALLNTAGSVFSVVDLVGSTGPGNNRYSILGTTAAGLEAVHQPSSTAYAGDNLSAGQALGLQQAKSGFAFNFGNEPLGISVSPGTYDVGVRYRCGGPGSLFAAKERTLAAWTRSFPA